MIRVGTSGWSYEEWVGPFYPVALRGRSDAWLAYYATRFRAVEINSTFYALPDADLVESWCRQGVAFADQPGAGGFELSLKLPREATHDALLAGDAARAREVAGRFDREVLDPLDGEGILGAVLVQLPPTLAATPKAVADLQEMLGALTERRVALEFRGPGWLTGGCVAPIAEGLFANPDVGLVESGGLGGVPDVRPPRRARHAYLRLHGRKFDPAAPARGEQLHDGARYDYLYDEDELAPWAARAREHEERHTETRVFFNNTTKAKATVNALQMLRMLGRAPGVPLPRLTEQTTLEI